MSRRLGMRCPYCRGSSLIQVIDSRRSRDMDFVRRRRICGHCGRRTTTYEFVEFSNPAVEKRDDKREPFDHAKISRSVRLALGKYGDPARAEYIAKKITKECRTLGILSSKAIAERVLTFLWDQREIPAYIRYGAGQNKIRHPEELMTWLRALQRRMTNQRSARIRTLRRIL